MRDEDNFDPEKFRITQKQQYEIGALKPKPKRARQLGKFVQVPDLWREQLCIIRAHGSTYRVALHLLHEAWRTGNHVVKLTNVALAEAGLGGEGRRLPYESCGRPGLLRSSSAPTAIRL